MPVEFIELKENLGFARANNVAWQKIEKKPGHHVLLLNPDTVVKPSALQNMLTVFERNPKAGIIGPHLLNPDGSTQPSVRALPTLAVLAFLFLKLPWIMPKSQLWQNYMQTGFDYTKEENVEQVMGAAFLIRDEVWQKAVGLLDERFWLWFEEVDYCERALKAGWEVMYTPTAEVIHWGATSFNQLIGWRRNKPFVSSALRYASKHFGIASYLVLLLLSPISLLLSSFRSNK